MNDLVSIIMPSYNTGQYIAESIESVLNQTYTNWELIIVDDCSTDDTDFVVATFNDSRIKYFKNDKNSGAAITRNKALRKAKGKWIAFLDSDDLWLPEKLEQQIKFMVENDYHFSYTKYEEIDENSVSIGVEVSGPKRITETGMYNYCWPGCLTVMYDAQYIGLIQIADIEKNNDYAMWLKVCKRANCFLLGERLAKYRKRKGSISDSNYLQLIAWHYYLFLKNDNKIAFIAVINTLRNLLFGVWKKIGYVRDIDV